MKDRADLPEARLRIRWAREPGKFDVLTIGGALIETVSREEMVPLMLSKHTHAAFLAKHGMVDDKQST